MTQKKNAGPREADTGEYRTPDSSGSVDPVQCTLARFAGSLFEPADIIEIRRLPSGRSTWHKAAELAAQAKSLADENRKGENIYIGANPRTQAGGRTAHGARLARTIFADFDHIAVEEAAKRCKVAKLPRPTLTVMSGHGVHDYWRLSEAIDPSEQHADPSDPLVPHGWGVWSNWQRDLAALLSSDPCVHDAPRIMRLPGFMNHKEPAALASIIDADACRVYELAELHERIPERPRDSPVSKKNATIATHSRLDVLARAAKYADTWPGVVEGGCRS